MPDPDRLEPDVSKPDPGLGWTLSAKVAFLVVGVAFYASGVVFLRAGEVVGGVASLLGGSGLLVTVLSSL